MIPVAPFASLLAVNGVRIPLARWQAAGAKWRPAPVLLIAGLGLGFVHDATRWRLGRANEGVQFASVLAAHAPNTAVAVEDMWRIGGRLYLGSVEPVIALDSSEIRAAGIGDDVLARVRSVALDQQTASRPAVSGRLPEAGYREVLRDAASGYVVYQR